MQRFYNLKMSVKIFILSVFLIAAVLVTGIMGISALNKQNKMLMQLNNERLVPVFKLEEAKSNFVNIRLSVLAHITTERQAEKANYEKDMAKYEEHMLTLLDDYSKVQLNQDEERELEALRKAIEHYKAVRSKVLSLSRDLKQSDAMNLANSEGKTAYENTATAYNNLIDMQMAAAESLYRNSERSYKYTSFEILMVMLLCVVFGVAVSLFIIRAVVIPVRKVTSKLEDISNNGGDLTQRIGLKGKDEIGQLSRAFDSFMDNLQNIISEVTESSQVIAASSQQLSAATAESNRALEQIAQTVNTIAGGTTDNVAVTQQTTASLNEASRASESTATATKKTNMNSLTVKEAAEQGAHQVGDIAETIQNISKSSKHVATLIGDLDASSQKISEIVQLITNISEQTNLLALNAAIEAARAGEAGRGFNVVAEEIRKLADESNQAAKNIITLVKDNLSKSENAVRSVNEVDHMVTIAVEKAMEVKSAIDQIIINITDVVQQVGSINKDVERQAVITEEITKAMNSIANNATDMAAGTEEISASVEEQVSTMEEIEATSSQLSDMAERLNKLTAGFKVRK